MALLGFKDQFVPGIRSGAKLHTIRGNRKVPIKVGETLYLYARVRQKGMYRIIEPVVCTHIREIEIDALIPDTSLAMLRIDGITLWQDEREELARADGFASYAEMLQFWIKNNKLPFKGVIIYWKRRA